MSTRTPPARRSILAAALVSLPGLAAAVVAGEPQAIPFESDRWVKGPATVVEHLGRPSLRGGAYLKDVEFGDGVIEVDMAMDGSRSFPGLAFHMRSPAECEYVYLRPHRSGSPVALQYTPMFNGLDAWQLYHGPGYTAAAEIPLNRWVHVRIEVQGSRARAYLDESSTPALVVDDLKHGPHGGTLGLVGPPTGAVHFSNFRFRPDAALDLPPAPRRVIPEGLITNWRLSSPLQLKDIDRELPPDGQSLPALTWRPVESESSGLVNISRWVARTTLLPEVVLAKAMITAPTTRRARLNFGYSDEISVFLNGKLLFNGDSSFLRRDPQFYGAVGLYDAVYLDLEKGANELLFMVAESYGGWGFIAQLQPLAGGIVALSGGVERLWTTPAQLQIPESAAFDARRSVFYVSNTTPSLGPGAARDGFVSRIKANGEIDALRWVDGLDAPTGIAVRGDTLFVVERNGLAEIDLPTGAIRARTPAPGAQFLNDVAVDSSGDVYVSDSGRNAILRRGAEALDVWVAGPEVARPNGLFVDGDRLIFGNNGDACIKSVDLRTGAVTSLFRLDAGTIDGIAADAAGNLIVSHWEGAVYRIDPRGGLRVLVDSRAAAINTADIAFDPARGLLLVPTFYDNRLSAHHVGAP